MIMQTIPASLELFCLRIGSFNEIDVQNMQLRNSSVCVWHAFAVQTQNWQRRILQGIHQQHERRLPMRKAFEVHGSSARL